MIMLINCNPTHEDKRLDGILSSVSFTLHYCVKDSLYCILYFSILLHSFNTSGGEYSITTEDGRVRPKHVLTEFKK
jgi:hypothetical protein